MSQRHIDLIVALTGLVLLSPAALLIAFLIRWDDGGPVLFTQMRLGRHKRPFRIYKFRTMQDGWITGIGRWLRATGLDELPQLINMLRGDMSLIGPRPLTEADVARLEWDDAAHALRWSVRPGVVGLAQLHAGRGARVSWLLDTAYVRERGAALDLRIVAMSAVVSVVGKRAVRERLRAHRLRRIANARSPAVRSAASGSAVSGLAVLRKVFVCVVMAGASSSRRLREIPIPSGIPRHARRSRDTHRDDDSRRSRRQSIGAPRQA